MKNRWRGEYDRWRLAFAGAKTADQFRHSLCDLFGRAGVNSVLREQWREVLPMLDAGHWQLTRDLAMLALASYKGKGAEETTDTEEQSTGEVEQ
jgi:CRISPR-associated protein Cas8a1/Csx13